jgi:valyl-tRNA synthetase
MDDKFLKPYEPATTEGRVYEAWEKSGYFNPDNLPGGKERKPFTIMMPPPNATGVLHMGHALFLALQDVMIRFKRMRGFATLWLPGTDHAAIATQSKVEKDIQKAEGKNRHEIGREEFMRRAETFVEESRGTIRSQIRAMGSSCDWSREAFTLDEARNRAVRRQFKDMYDAGLIYRGHRIVNWDPKGQTTISDDEIVHEERQGKLYTFRYAKDFPIAIATTRPETKVGDVAVAVHPEDARYKDYVGKEYNLTFCDMPLTIKVIADTSVEPGFGTGALGVTPAHSQTDWEIGERHNLPHPQVINEYAKMETPGGRLHGKKVGEAREMVVEWLKTEGLLEKEETVTQNISTAERTGGIVEPLPKLQWFIAVNKPVSERGGKTLKELLLEPVQGGRIQIIPDHFDKTYFHWIENLRDWCISRQIWYGHRVPVWYRGEEVAVGELPTGEGWTQDEDTLDTWFSSGLWTFSTLGWPEETMDLSRFHPTDVLETGHDILFFWVARMILMTQFALGDIPFRTIYLHGIVRDAKGQKFSKSLGNGIDPVEVAQKFGADAVRMALIVGNTPGTDTRMSEDKIKGYKLFANKLWNVSRFVYENTKDANLNAPLTETDAPLISELDTVIADVAKDIDEYRIYLGAEKLYHYVWDRFAAEILEESKTILGTHEKPSESTPESIASRKALLLTLLSRSLKALHPYMPFVTEEIWTHHPERKDFLMVSDWPTA